MDPEALAPGQGGLAAAAAAGLVGLWPAGESEIRFKGEPVAFTVFASRGGEPARPLDPETALRPGDVLRFGVVCPRPGHVAVAGVDEAGRVSRYYPKAGNGSAAIEGREYLQLLPGSVGLDETVGREWIALVVSAAPLEPRRVEEALRKAWRERAGDQLGPVALEALAKALLICFLVHLARVCGWEKHISLGWFGQRLIDLPLVVSREYDRIFS